LKEILFLEKIKKINLRNLFQINAVPRNLRETTKLKTKDSAYAKASADKAKTQCLGSKGLQILCGIIFPQLES
jgi:hypothetical protein